MCLSDFCAFVLCQRMALNLNCFASDYVLAGQHSVNYEQCAMSGGSTPRNEIPTDSHPKNMAACTAVTLSEK